MPSSMWVVIMTDGDAGEDFEEGGADFRVRAGLGRKGVVLLSAQVMHLRRELSDALA